MCYFSQLLFVISLTDLKFIFFQFSISNTTLTKLVKEKRTTSSPSFLNDSNDPEEFAHRNVMSFLFMNFFFYSFYSFLLFNFTILFYPYHTSTENCPYRLFKRYKRSKRWRLVKQHLADLVSFFIFFDFLHFFSFFLVFFFVFFLFSFFCNCIFFFYSSQQCLYGLLQKLSARSTLCKIFASMFQGNLLFTSRQFIEKKFQTQKQNTPTNLKQSLILLLY